MIFKIEKVDLIRKADGKLTKEWDFTSADETHDLEAYRAEIMAKFKATKVGLTYSEIPKSNNP